jgi:hypothetical protein
MRLTKKMREAYTTVKEGRIGTMTIWSPRPRGPFPHAQPLATFHDENVLLSTKNRTNDDKQDGLEVNHVHVDGAANKNSTRQNQNPQLITPQLSTQLS